MNIELPDTLSSLQVYRMGDSWGVTVSVRDDDRHEVSGNGYGDDLPKLIGELAEKATFALENTAWA